MKQGIHPDLHKVKFVCACGATFDGESTVKGDVYKCEICKECHPMFTGKQKVVDASGRLEKFERKLNKNKSDK